MAGGVIFLQRTIVHDQNIRQRLLDCLDEGLQEPEGLEIRRLPRAVQPMANRRFMQSLTPAAVLVGIVDEPQRLSVILTERAADMRAHAGQISFPGGRRDSADISSVATAKREAREEINLDSAYVLPIGYLGQYPTVTGFLVTPVVALVSPRGLSGLQRNPAEVKQILQIPLRHLLQMQHYRRGWLNKSGFRVPYYDIHWRSHRVWGATAAILVELALRIRGRGQNTNNSLGYQHE